MSGAISDCHNLEGGAPGIYWAEVKDAARHATTYRTPLPHPTPETKNLLIQNDRGVEGQKTVVLRVSHTDLFRGGSGTQDILP